MERLKQIFQEFGDLILSMVPNLLAALLVLGLFIVAGIIVDRIINGRLKRKWHDTVVAEFIGGVIRWIFITLGIISALHFVGFGGIAASVITGAGVSAIILGFAFKDIAENFLAGILLAVNRPFKIGDIIQSDSFKGPVKKLDLRVTHIRTADGRDIYVPNGMIVKNVLVNYTKDGLLRQEFMVGLDTGDDVAKARDVVMEYFTKQPDILKQPKPNLVVDEIGVSSVNVKVLFWVDVLKQKPTAETSSDTGEIIKSRVMREVKDLLLSSGFSLPSVVLEHKMYKQENPLEIQLSEAKK